ncbi:hypothetical protein Nepgr_028537 [Nepenthes gracilis]|uniref:Uncharacterized protein n=1 Tax=Nepenthes gracilis TaxID=150966 RepID=A0AAD3TCG3_NEPGR|nr:hypothetical protein Nepgr_028537 [Nepenthes gracilis]
MMGKKSGSRRMVSLILSFSLLLAAVAVSTSRKLDSITQRRSIQDPSAQGNLEFRVSAKIGREEEGRSAIEIDDYSPPGSNPGHDPPPPLTL